jgi:aminopeptidase N
VAAGQLDVGVPASTTTSELTIDYGYEFHSRFEGVMESGVTLVWPYWCGNMFPCKSAPDDGLTFTMTLTGTPTGEVAVYPTTIPADAPSYMIAWAVGDYTYLDLGTTDAGTKVGAWYLPNGMMAAQAGTANLRGVVDWLEKTYGAYVFGSEVAAVSAPWGFGAIGGMEHHPLWHVATSAMADEETQAHEAAHGWFGNGVRIACWEDFVLSEGTVTYLAARALEAVAGSSTGTAIWNDYQSRLDNLLGSTSENQIAWPDSCNQVDILDDGLFNDAPYIKGAFFYRALELKVGAQAVDDALSAFYTQYKGKAAGMQDMLDVIKTETGYDAQACALDWLRNQGRPTDDACP